MLLQYLHVMNQLVLLLSYPLVMHPVEISLLAKLIPGCRCLHQQAVHEPQGAQASAKCVQQHSAKSSTPS